MTLKMKLDNLDLFTKVMNAAAAVLEDEGTFLVSPADGLTLRNMDKSRFAMVDLKVEPSYFVGGEFECDEEMLLTIQMQDLKKILQRARKDDSLTILLDEKNETLKFLFEGNVKKEFTLPLRLGEKNVLPDPSSLELKAKAKLRGGALTEFIRDAAIIGGPQPSVKLTIDSGILTFSSVQDRKEVSIKLSVGDDDSDALEIESDEECSSLYSVDTFKNLVLVDQAFSSVSLAFSSDHPLKLFYDSGTGIKLGYLLAPMQADTDVEEEEDSDALADEDWDDVDEDDEDWDDDED